MAKGADEKVETPRERRSGPSLASIRALLARLVWLVCLVCALLLVFGALLVALKANPQNELVRFVKDAADSVDLGFFDRRNGVMKFDEGAKHMRMVKNALVNWGLAAVAWLVIGRVLSRLVRG